MEESELTGDELCDGGFRERDVLVGAGCARGLVVAHGCCGVSERAVELMRRTREDEEARRPACSCVHHAL